MFMTAVLYLSCIVPIEHLVKKNDFDCGGSPNFIARRTVTRAEQQLSSQSLRVAV
jgi:hypothetical protein